MAATKEIHYFDTVPDRGVSWYAAHFEGVKDEIAIGEATPNYLSNPGAAARIGELLPAVRLIAILRNPADRAYSAYQHGRSIGRETRTFVAALEDELEGRVARDARGRDLPPYIEEGRYIGQLQRLSTYVPRGRIHAVLFEDLLGEPADTYRGVCSFLGVSEDPVPEIVGRVVNGHQGFRSLSLRRIVKRLPDRRLWHALGRALGAVNRRSQAYPPMSERERATLGDLYDADVDRLAVWLDRDLSGWIARA